MVATKVTRIVLKFLICFISFLVCESYEVPNLTIEILSPKGFRASVPDIPKLGLFAFQGNVNRPIPKNRVGAISGEVVEPTDGRWVFEDPDVNLEVGDTIYYYFYVSINSVGYLNSNLSYTVKAPGDSLLTSDLTITQHPEVSECPKTLTKVAGGIVCAGQVIFEDDFSAVREDLWRIEQYIPLNQPEYPFVSYQKTAVSVADGLLHITPRLQSQMPGFNNDSIYNGILNLRNGCTKEDKLCYLQAVAAEILPPVVSGRLTSQNFAFTYGTMHVRAQIPWGDWLYPEILLQPLDDSSSAGFLKIASARGNKVLYSDDGKAIGNEALYGGPSIDPTCREYLLANPAFLSLVAEGKNWSDDFHHYSLHWEPDLITLSVDGKEWLRVEPAPSGLWNTLPPSCRNGTQRPPSGHPSIAPFNKPYYITLGVAAGGTGEFKDGIATEGGPKPWKNRENEAAVNFWRSVDAWYPSWQHPELLIDYIKVVAL